MGNTVVIKGNGIKSEFICKEDIYPGMLAEVIVENGLVKIKKNTNAGNLKETAFVTEYEGFGMTILDKSVAGDTAHVYFANSGDVVYIMVDSGVQAGDILVSDGAGKLRKTEINDSGLGITAVALEDAVKVTDTDYFASVMLV